MNHSDVDARRAHEGSVSLCPADARLSLVSYQEPLRIGQIGGRARAARSWGRYADVTCNDSQLLELITLVSPVIPGLGEYGMYIGGSYLLWNVMITVPGTGQIFKTRHRFPSFDRHCLKKLV